MIIGILPHLDNKTGGIYQYCLSMLESLLTLKNKDNSFVVFSDVYRHPLFQKMTELNWKHPSLYPRVRVKYVNRNIIIKNVLKSTLPSPIFSQVVNLANSLYRSSTLRNISKKIKGNIATKHRFLNYGVEMMIYLSSNALAYEINIPFVFVIHDLQHKYYPDFFTKEEIKARDKIFNTASEQALLVVCESEYVKRDIVKFYKVTENKIKVLPSPPPSYILNKRNDPKVLAEVKLKYKLPDRYLFYPAHFWRHKNHLNLLKAIKYINKKHKEFINLVLVGSKKDYYPLIQKEIKNLDLKDQVHYLGFIPDLHIPYLYQNAEVLVMPTLFESLSLPIWEAFALGVPVISSNICALPEQVKDDGLLFDPQNIEEIGNKIYKIWTDNRLKKKLRTSGYKRIKSMTLKSYGRGWLKIISEVRSILQKT